MVRVFFLFSYFAIQDDVLTPTKNWLPAYFVSGCLGGELVHVIADDIMSKMPPNKHKQWSNAQYNHKLASVSHIVFNQIA